MRRSALFVTGIVGALGVGAGTTISLGGDSHG